MNQHAHTNRLINESSPYLLQHAHNPVDWHPWGEEALSKARDQNKLILVSIGYAACHWCHVMEKESFEDEEVAKLMNDNFICIKVDREERPDIDQIYMDACQIVRGNGGWPLNAFALPDGRPLDAMTYLPKTNWLKVLSFFNEYYPANMEEAEKRANLITDGVKQLELAPSVADDQVDLPEGLLNQAYLEQADSFDKKNGGRQGAPKFPMPTGLDWLLLQSYLKPDSEANHHLVLSLNKMANGGIYDFVGGGFARYSVDAEWFLPHFEKMLYDNAQLIQTYADAYRFCKEDTFLNVAEETANFCIRELRDENGGFYSSLDADSEGMEGKYYVWTIEEIEEALTESSIFKKLFDIRFDGNWEHGFNILAKAFEEKSAMKEFHLSGEAYQKMIQESRQQLFEYRQKRVRPGLDDKILTSWNALMVSGLTALSKATQKSEYIDAAITTASFLVESVLEDDGRLNRNYKNGKSSINAYLDDYALLIRAFIDLFEYSLDIKWLENAELITAYASKHFEDPDSPYLYYTSDMDPALAARKKETGDNVIPSSNAVMAENYWRLGHLLFREDWIKRSRQMVVGMQEFIRKYPAFYAYWGRLATTQSQQVYEVAVVGPQAIDQINNLQRNYTPDAIFLGAKSSESPLELLKGKWIEDETLIYVCVNKSCQMPVKSIEDALQQMNTQRS